jgi:hypothetical protein
MDDRPIAFHDVQSDSFPMTIQFVSEATGKVLHVITVDGPGVVDVPGQDFFKSVVAASGEDVSGDINIATRIITPRGTIYTDSQGSSHKE